jgi:hypothetical protein
MDAGEQRTRETNMRNWSEMDLSQIDLATLPGGDREALHAEVKRRAHCERSRVLRDGIAWLRRVLLQPKRSRGRGQVYAPIPRGPLDLIFGGRA